jgi:mannose-6-phosphate isomerase-like protein (cupin superfamily)
MMDYPTWYRPDHNDQYATSERCAILELWNHPEDNATSIAQATVDPGVITRWHFLIATQERYVILAGHGVVYLDQLPGQPVQPGDVVFIPAQCRQCIHNTGSQPLVFLAICTPRFRIDAYREC